MVIENLACVIPSYGKVELTETVVRACLAELEAAHVVVVDNAGDYAAVADEVVLVPGHNLGWLRGCNEGMSYAFTSSVDAVVLMNNDVTLSGSFFAGLRDAMSATGAGLIAPCYDDYFRCQSRYWTGPAERFPVQPVERPAKVVDGTSLLITRKCYDRVGGLDEVRFGRYGWGGDADLCVRVRAAGFGLVVTRRSYLNHARGATADSMALDYRQAAWVEMNAGMTGLYGRSWRRRIGYWTDGTGPGGLAGKVYHGSRRARAALRLRAGTERHRSGTNPSPVE